MRFKSPYDEQFSGGPDFPISAALVQREKDCCVIGEVCTLPYDPVVVQNQLHLLGLFLGGCCKKRACLFAKEKYHGGCLFVSY